MEKRTLLAVVVSILILLAWDFFFIQPRVDENLPEETAVLEQKEPEKLILPPAEKKTSPAEETTVVDDGKNITINTPLYTATISTRGAQLTSLKLDKFYETMDEDAPAVEMINDPMPTITIGGSFSDKNLMYETSCPAEIEVDKERDIVLSTPLAEGIVLKKIFSIHADDYLIGYTTEVVNSTADRASLAMQIRTSEPYAADEKASRYTFEGPVLLNGNHLEEFKTTKLKKTGSYRSFDGEIKWFGYENKYFLKVMICPDAPESSVAIRRINDQSVGLVYDIPTTNIEADSSISRNFIMYVGPKEIHSLKTAGYGLKKALDFGFFDIIAKPMLLAMNWIQNYTHSYGLAIIILTFIIKLLLYPLSLKSFTSMKELQKVQPLMKELQEQYKDDKQKLNEEMMKLYSEHKINPMGGCLPMLLQIPILFALYRVFLSAIELRHTPFHICGTWLPDLSAKDPYYITPILMGLSQFIMQKMTPTAGDATQQKMMLIMPVIFTFLFLNFPSGLVLYWLISNILSIVQQAYINRAHS